MAMAMRCGVQQGYGRAKTSLAKARFGDGKYGVGIAKKVWHWQGEEMCVLLRQGEEMKVWRRKSWVLSSNGIATWCYGDGIALVRDEMRWLRSAMSSKGTVKVCVARVWRGVTLRWLGEAMRGEEWQWYGKAMKSNGEVMESDVRVWQGNERFSDGMVLIGRATEMHSSEPLCVGGGRYRFERLG